MSVACNLSEGRFTRTSAHIRHGCQENATPAQWCDAPGRGLAPNNQSSPCRAQAKWVWARITSFGVPRCWGLQGFTQPLTRCRRHIQLFKKRLIRLWCYHDSGLIHNDFLGGNTSFLHLSPQNKKPAKVCIVERHGGYIVCESIEQRPGRQGVEVSIGHDTMDTCLAFVDGFGSAESVG